MENNLCRIALIQTSAGPDKHENISRALQQITIAVSHGAKIISFPELFSTIYFPQYIGLDVHSYSDTLNSSFIETFQKIAKENRVVLIVPFCEMGNDFHHYNSAIVIDVNGKLFSPYHKIHLPQDPGFYEKGYFSPGQQYQIYKTEYASIGVLICYDQWFPEAARTVALMGADILFYPTSIGHIGGEIPGEGDWKEAWQLIQRSHAIANSVPVAAINRCGWEGDLFFFGGSFVCDAFGLILSEAGSDEQILYTDLDFSVGPCIREGWGFFRNRRTDTYHSLLLSPSESDPSPILTPLNQGYHMPAEWEQHDAVWIAWPHNDLTFPHLENVEETFLEICTALQGSEQIDLLVPDLETQNKVLHFLKLRGFQEPCIRFHQVQYSDVWIRDYGPTFVVNHALKKISAVSWIFNAWGDKYDELITDGTISNFIPEFLEINSFSPGIILEGGSIDVNGKGCVLTTRHCLLNPNRNPHLSQEEIEHYLSEYLCIKKVIWLNEGIAGDDTDGHIDDIARFVNPTTIVCAVEKDPGDKNYPILQENLQILYEATDQDNNPFTIVPIPMPSEVSDDEYRYPATYLNFYIGNKVVLVPVFNDPNDKEALTILQDLFTDRIVIGISSRSLVEGFGTIHCATQQQPVAISSFGRYKDS